MKKGNKKLLVIAALLLLVAVSFTTYAIYKISKSGTATVSTAAFVVKVNDVDLKTQNLTFNLSNVQWTNNPSKVAGKIAPGATGVIPLTVDATGSEVNVSYTVSIDSILVNGEAIDSDTGLTITSSKASGTILYNATSMTANAGLNVSWPGTDSTTKNAADLNLAGKDVVVTVTVTAYQAAADAVAS